jgi:hypothetical protein
LVFEKIKYPAVTFSRMRRHSFGGKSGAARYKTRKIEKGPPKDKDRRKTKKNAPRKTFHYGSLPGLLSHDRAYKRWLQSLPWPVAHFASAKPSAKRFVCPTR